MGKDLFILVVSVMVLYFSFILGCCYLDDIDLFEVCFFNFNLAPKSTFITLWLLAFVILKFLYRIVRSKVPLVKKASR